MKKMLMVVSALMALLGFSAIMAGTAGASTHAVITFTDTSATLTIPTPACPSTQPSCRWKFFLNEPKTHVDVATVYSTSGTSGTLTLDYPPGFCGIIQADAYIGGPPWVPQRGYQYNVDCDSSTPSSPSGSSTPSPDEPGPTSQLPGDAPTGSGATTPPVAVTPTATASPTATPTPIPSPDALPSPSALPFTATTPTPVTATPTRTTSAPAELPFTGVNAGSLLLTGLGLLAFGLLLLSETDRWRRLGRRVVAFVNGPV